MKSADTEESRCHPASQSATARSTTSGSPWAFPSVFISGLAVSGSFGRTKSAAFGKFVRGHHIRPHGTLHRGRAAESQDRHPADQKMAKTDVVAFGPLETTRSHGRLDFDGGRRRANPRDRVIRTGLRASCSSATWTKADAYFPPVFCPTLRKDFVCSCSSEHLTCMPPLSGW